MITARKIKYCGDIGEMIARDRNFGLFIFSDGSKYCIRITGLKDTDGNMF